MDTFRSGGKGGQNEIRLKLLFACVIFHLVLLSPVSRNALNFKTEKEQ
jgi:hypothetical protein